MSEVFFGRIYAPGFMRQTGLTLFKSTRPRKSPSSVWPQNSGEKLNMGATKTAAFEELLQERERLLSEQEMGIRRNKLLSHAGEN
jgi:hypothetical protein